MRTELMAGQGQKTNGVVSAKVHEDT